MKAFLLPLAVLALGTLAVPASAVDPAPANGTPAWGNCENNPREGCLNFIGPLQPSFCENNPNAPACGPEGLVQNGGANDWKPVAEGGAGAVCSETLQICTKLDAESEIWKKLTEKPGTQTPEGKADHNDHGGAYNAYNAAADGGILKNLAGDEEVGDYCLRNNYPIPCRLPDEKKDENGGNGKEDKKEPPKNPDFETLSTDEQNKQVADADKKNKKQSDDETKPQKDSGSRTPSGDPKKNTYTGPYTPNNPTGGKGGAPEITDSTALTCEDFPDQARCLAAKVKAKKDMDAALKSGAALRSLNAEDDGTTTTIAQAPDRLNHSGIFGRLRGIADRLYSSIPGMGNGTSGTDTTLVSSVDGAVANANSDFQGNSTTLPTIRVTKKTGVFGGTYVAPEED
ncbi:MAG: hypothetical protein A2X36_13375 [Elusimicrobia bacterium GWA2_69_24]|nr:MAG: hypothetical protein A2X36_13375 [Elusimicrobia bacterium GWA2_69_24]